MKILGQFGIENYSWKIGIIVNLGDLLFEFLLFLEYSQKTACKKLVKFTPFYWLFIAEKLYINNKKILISLIFLCAIFWPKLSKYPKIIYYSCIMVLVYLWSIFFLQMLQFIWLRYDLYSSSVNGIISSFSNLIILVVCSLEDS